MLDLHRLRSLRELAARGTMTAAAEALNYTPSAISQQLAALEADVGATLLEPRGRRVALTPAGRVLVEESEALFAAMERATTAVATVAGQIVGPVHVGAFQSAGARIVPPALACLNDEHPDLEVHFVQWEEQGLRELRLGHLDIWLDQEYEVLPMRRYEGLDARVLLVEPLYLAVPSDADAGPDLDAYGDRRWIAEPQTSEFGRLIPVLTGRAGIEPDVRFHTDDIEVTLQLVAAGLGVSILPRLATYRVPGGVELHQIEGTERRVKALTQPEVTQRPAVQLVLDHLERAGSAT
ncbi:MAG: LysR family transcriptional regulator [Nitriliruptorales bacterium]|nr:LysR family transcriptional regulator [Nitriliruptorales bacterium]